MTLPRYPSYKPSGAEWMLDVPSHWTVNRGRHIYDQVVRPPEDGDGVVTAFRDGQVTLRENRRTDGFTMAILEVGYQRVLEGELVIHGMDAFAGAIGVSESTGKCTPEYTVLRPRQSGIDNRYFAHALRIMAARDFIYVICPSVRERAPRFRFESFKDVLLPCPSPDEQARIAAFLDHETSKIDALVAEQERLIELLKEKRQAVISHAVTKGLNPDAPMKDSGIESLGEVPAHWVVKRFQRCVYVVEGQVDPERGDYAELPLIAPNHVESGTGRLLGLESASEQGAESGKYLCRAGDVVYSKIRPALRKACIAPQECLCSADMYPLRAHSGLINPYLLWVILSEQFSSFAVLESQRVAMPKINRESLKEVSLVLPPEAEQQAIAAFLERETTKIDALASQAGRAVDLLQERRTALISAAVTGQIDVRPESMRTAA